MHSKHCYGTFEKESQRDDCARRARRSCRPFAYLEGPHASATKHFLACGISPLLMRPVNKDPKVCAAIHKKTGVKPVQANIDHYVLELKRTGVTLSVLWLDYTSKRVDESIIAVAVQISDNVMCNFCFQDREKGGNNKACKHENLEAIRSAAKGLEVTHTEYRGENAPYKNMCYVRVTNDFVSQAVKRGGSDFRCSRSNTRRCGGFALRATPGRVAAAATPTKTIKKRAAKVPPVAKTPTRGAAHRLVGTRFFIHESEWSNAKEVEGLRSTVRSEDDCFCYEVVGTHHKLSHMLTIKAVDKKNRLFPSVERFVVAPETVQYFAARKAGAAA